MVTPMHTEIIIQATRTQNVLGEKGKRIRELTSVVQKMFKFPKNSVELYAEKVNNSGLCAIAQAESLRYKLLDGLAVCSVLVMSFKNSMEQILCISDLNVAVIICDPIGEPKPYVPESGAGFFSAFPLQGTQQGALSYGGCVSSTLLVGPRLAPKSIREAALQVEVDSGYIGKKCDLRGGWPLNIVTKGIVQDVEPVAIFGNRRLGKGNFKVYVKSIIYRSTGLIIISS
ncbi:hypothetical protein IFM89_000972 [Coptis chinensis]|uniref:KH type-2 domain-containing protein n=1 Tax=Coptis chinensis TaxID=261450 RepID=A0A835M6L8_9MAGN|nr:hypothetical protein IFM89_000972 [Coptis chinensis]